MGKQEQRLKEKYAPKQYVTELPAVGTISATTTARTPEEAERKFRNGRYKVGVDEDVDIDFEKLIDPGWSLDIKQLGGE